MVASRTAELASANNELSDAKVELEAQNEELRQAQANLADVNMTLEMLATIDGLTGIKNHRAFQEQLDMEWRRRMRTMSPLSLILFDVDHFKTFNDTYGHPKGDDVLRRVGEILMENARDGDFVARYGGEEFIVLAPDTGADGALVLAERLRVALESATWPLREITASFGVASTSLSISSPSELISAADSAMYDAKHKGRNVVCY